MAKIDSNHQLKGGIDILGIDNSVPLKPKYEQFYTPEEIASFRARAYKDLEWELKAPRGGSPWREEKKTPYTFDKSLERIYKEGGPDARHPYSWEVFGLMVDGLEGKISGNLLEVYNDMLIDGGEWMNLVFASNKYTYSFGVLDPKNLIWDENGRRYITLGKKLQSSYKFKFDTFKRNTRRETVYKTSYLSEGFIEFLYGRRLNEFPLEMSDGRVANPLINLPPFGIIGCIGRCDFNYNPYVFGYRNLAASRWVRPKI